MAVNLRLSRARAVPAGDPLGRTWVGWSATSTDDELWEINRGRWSLSARVDKERYATLSFDGRVQVVAELSGRHRCDDGDRVKWRLEGTVLRPGDPAHDTLKGRPVQWHRNPVGYFDSQEIDEMAPGQRAAFTPREPATMVVTWNPDKWNPDGTWAEKGYPQEVRLIAGGGLLRGQWATGGRTSGIEPGDRVFFLRQGRGERGVIGSGTAASRIFSDGHWDGERSGDHANYVLIDWDTLLLPEDALPHETLIRLIPEGGIWRPQASGWVLPPTAASKLEALWADHLGLEVPPPRSTARQGWQMDPVRRKKVEDAAQARLEAHFRSRDWDVRDMRFGNPYDAVAVKDGRTLWLEAKGTETSGTSVIATPNEVGWARQHPGRCVLGILSDVTFGTDGEIDPASGTFRLFVWNPDGGDLAPRAYDFTPGSDDRFDATPPGVSGN